MIHELGMRGKTAALVVAGIAVAGTGYALNQHDWADAAGLSVLTYLSLLASGVWATTRSVLRNTIQIAQRQNAIRAGQRKQLDAVRAKLEKLRIRLGRNAAADKAPSTGQHSVERRYADILNQPASVPNNSLLAYLELLSKDATTRKADELATRDAIAELRDLVRAQHEEIVELRELLTAVDALERSGSSL